MSVRDVWKFILLSDSFRESYHYGSYMRDDIILVVFWEIISFWETLYIYIYIYIYIF